MSHIFNIDAYYENNAKIEGWQKEEFTRAVQKVEEKSLNDLRNLAKKVGNPADINFFESAPNDELILYLFSDVNKDILIKEL